MSRGPIEWRPLAAACAAAAMLAGLVAAPAPALAAAKPKASWTRVTLPNGLQVVVVPTSRLPLVDFRLVARAGSVNDPAGREGPRGGMVRLVSPPQPAKCALGRFPSADQASLPAVRLAPNSSSRAASRGLGWPATTARRSARAVSNSSLMITWSNSRQCVMSAAASRRRR